MSSGEELHEFPSVIWATVQLRQCILLESAIQKLLLLIID